MTVCKENNYLREYHLNGKYTLRIVHHLRHENNLKLDSIARKGHQIQTGGKTEKQKNSSILKNHAVPSNFTYIQVTSVLPLE